MLYEGYLLYPYRSSSAKNQLRWQFGLLSPRGAAAAGVGEESGLRATVLLRPAPGDRLEVHVRFLQVQWRAVESAVDGRYAPVDRLRVGDTDWVPWHEAVEQDLAVTVPVADLAAGRTVPLAVEGGTDTESLRDPDGRPVGRLVRTRWPVASELSPRRHCGGRLPAAGDRAAQHGRLGPGGVHPRPGRPPGAGRGAPAARRPRPSSR